ncbi:uncharacterized protein MONBRDRAFT_27467 [Monosiga brevicollis MX1]|uniref:Uncharacterized protein n=1 Tax=Monosiga brevicollis TaxID=81824 RepID=A9V5C8_MONBE|nr:uncharacterized protein MONBRDRAFT_27467 [Monosiga brevicollis MX1]EDQ87258.1 predicted protein [Monosiga brevicollis MX1]|eukprot:XP_001747871.1 hypothetical protein [Monosiga brevicollis MX1]
MVDLDRILGLANLRSRLAELKSQLSIASHGEIHAVLGRLVYALTSDETDNRLHVMRLTQKREPTEYKLAMTLTRPTILPPGVLDFFMLRFAAVIMEQATSSGSLNYISSGTVYFDLVFDYLGAALPQSEAAFNGAHTVQQSLLHPHRSAASQSSAHTGPAIFPTAASCERVIMCLMLTWAGKAMAHRDIESAINADCIGALSMVARFHHCSHSFLRSKSNSAFHRELLRSLEDVVAPALQRAVYHVLDQALDPENNHSYTDVALELWFKYGRPWRYGYNVARDAQEQGSYTSDAWASFVEANAPLYSIGFQHLAARAVHFDYTFDATRWVSGKPPKEQIRLLNCLELFAGTKVTPQDKDLCEGTLGYDLWRLEENCCLHGSSNSPIQQALARLSTTQQVAYVPILSEKCPPITKATSNGSAAAVAQTRFLQNISAIGKALRHAMNVAREREEKLDRRAHNWIAYVFPDPELQPSMRSALRRYQGHLSRVHLLLHNLFQEVAIEVSLVYSYAVACGLANENASHQPRRSFEIPVMVGLLDKLSDWINDEFEIKPWLKTSAEEAYATIEDERYRGEGAFAVWPMTSADGALARDRYNIVVRRHGENHRDVIVSTASGMLTLDGVEMFGEIGELVRFYQRVPYYLDRNGAAHILAQVEWLCAMLDLYMPFPVP